MHSRFIRLSPHAPSANPQRPPRVHAAPPAQATRPAAASLPEEEWPLMVQIIARLRRPGETGLGDTIARLATKLRADRAAALWKKITTRSCGCLDRRRYLNRHYPYPPSSAAAT